MKTGWYDTTLDTTQITTLIKLPGIYLSPAQSPEQSPHRGQHGAEASYYFAT